MSACAFLRKNHRILDDVIIIVNILRSKGKTHERRKRTLVRWKKIGIDVEEFNDRRDSGSVINVMLVKGRANSLRIITRNAKSKWERERKREEEGGKERERLPSQLNVPPKKTRENKRIGKKLLKKRKHDFLSLKYFAHREFPAWKQFSWKNYSFLHLVRCLYKIQCYYI